MNLSSVQAVTLLSVDDDEGHAILLGRCLAGCGFRGRIEHFPGGEELLEFLSRPLAFGEMGLEKNYVILLDIRMPKIDGVDLLRVLKADPRLRRIPVIMFSTTEDPREIERCYDLGCGGFVRKPVDFALFQDAVSKLARFIDIMAVPSVGCLAANSISMPGQTGGMSRPASGDRLCVLPTKRE